MPMDSAAHHKTIVALDTVGRADSGRAAHPLVEHEGFWELLRTSFVNADVPWHVLFPKNTGEGVVIQLPDQVARTDLLACLPDCMLAGVQRYNAVHAERMHVQLRAAFHAGEVCSGRHGEVVDAATHTLRLAEASETKKVLKHSGAALALILSDSFYKDVVRAGSAADVPPYRRIQVSFSETTTEAWLRLFGPAVIGFPVRELLSTATGPALPALVEALLAVPCVRGSESRRLLLELFPRRDIADIVPYHAEDRLHVIALARTCRRFTRGLADLLDVIRLLEPESRQVAALAVLIDGG
ncbi:hypothetical protein DMA12_03970 [Amycolatopsis balhimycina DSM 5908]|uniref:Effector-associated domain-containing protein n=1 Tax=Amycolatopsis balhimycina DSM 5908 TaxID=1081091 RepID=A0A428X2N6_AMYBA|nr:hypothetical protein [Amycolatopsis balhimycina]RSM49588.1 hypothetical protein DMA12_03970 [Amycolatopsis balhimycina DSM 5908]